VDDIGGAPDTTLEIPDMTDLRAIPQLRLKLTYWVSVSLLLFGIASGLRPDVVRAAETGTNTSLLTAPMTDKKPVKVRVGLFLTNLIDVDEVKEMYHISGYLFMSWKDPRLSFAPDGTDERTYEQDKIWVPHVHMINSTELHQSVSVNIRGDADGTIRYLELFQAELTTSFYLEPFPFDTQSLELFLEPFLDERDSIALEYDSKVAGVGTEPFVELAQWRILGLRGTQHHPFIGATRDRISELEIDVQVQRRSRYYVWKVFLPLFVMVGIAYSAFWIKISDYDTQITVTLTAILTEIAFLFAISTSLPKVPYLTFMDAFFLLSFAFSCACIIELVMVHQSLERNRNSYADRLRKISRVLYPIVYLGIILLAAMVFLGAAAVRRI
jgi:hypothetical protein